MLNIDLNNQVALVTGTTSGIGFGVAQVLAKAGCHIVGCSREKEGAEKVNKFLEKIENEGRTGVHVEADVTSLEGLEKLVDKAIQTFDKIDILISSAGANLFKGGEKCSQEEWDYCMQLNLWSHWMLSKLCKKHLVLSENGLIVIMNSNHAFESLPGSFPYNVSKSALIGLVNSMAVEWGPEVRVVGLAPGFIETEGGDKWFDLFPNPKEKKERIIKSHPAGKLGSPEEIGGLCAFLASQYAKFITGTTYLVDGGKSALMRVDE